MYQYPSLDRVRDILTRANADGAANEEFESGIRSSVKTARSPGVGAAVPERFVRFREPAVITRCRCW
jgi:hypothetical protein